MPRFTDNVSSFITVGISTAVAVPLIILSLFVGGFLQKLPKLHFPASKQSSAKPAQASQQATKPPSTSTPGTVLAPKIISPPATPRSQGYTTGTSTGRLSPTQQSDGLGISMSADPRRLHSGDKGYAATESTMYSPFMAAEAEQSKSEGVVDVERGATAMRKRSLFAHIFWRRDP